MGGAPTNPVWVYNLRSNPAVEIRDHTVVQPMRVREVEDASERARLWQPAVEAGCGGVSAIRGVPGEDHAADPGIRGRADEIASTARCLADLAVDRYSPACSIGLPLRRSSPTA